MSGISQKRCRSQKIIKIAGLSLSIWEILFLLSLVSGAMIRIYLAYHAPADIDENYYSFDGHLLEEGHTPFQDFPSRSPLFILLSAAILRLGGDFFTLRLMTVLFSLCTGILIFYTGKLLSGVRTGAIASLLFFLSPYSIRYGYTFITQPFEAFGLGLSFYLLLRWTKMSNNQLNRDGNGVLRQNSCLILSGITLGLSVFVRRNALAFFPAGLLILYYCLAHRNRDGKAFANRGLYYFLFSIGFLSMIIPGILLFVHITDLSFTTYFFYSDYIHTHNSILGNLNFSFTAFDTRGYYLLSSAMVFITLTLWKVSGYALENLGIKGDLKRGIERSAIFFITIGWALAAFSLLGNNYLDAMDNAVDGIFYGIVLLCCMIGAYRFEIAEFADKKREKPMAIQHLPIITATIFGILIVALSGRDFYWTFNAIILLNLLAVVVLFKSGLGTAIRFRKASHNDFASPWIVLGIFFFSVLIFYLLFRVMLPYYYDLLFPLCLLTAMLLESVVRHRPTWDWKGLARAGKALFIATLILSVPVSIAKYSYLDIQGNQTDISDLEDCANYLKANADPHEEILTAKPLIALQADLEIVFNIVRAGVYKKNDTELLDRLNYPLVEEIQEYLGEKGIRFVIMEWGLRAYFLDVYPEFEDYIVSHYQPVESFGSIEVWVRK